MTSAQALMVLNAVGCLGARRVRLLIETFSNPQDVLSRTYDDLVTEGGLTESMASQLKAFRQDEFIKAETAAMSLKGVTFLTYRDEDFPERLLAIEDAPVCLYAWGKRAVLKQKAVAIVGSRHAGPYGHRMARQFAMDFVHAGLVVVSGLARGIDASAHQGCLSAGGDTIGVVGCGLSHVYPNEHRSLYEHISRQGVVISEYAMGTKPIGYNFPWRNRLISGLSEAVVIIEAAQKSGALITATYGASQGKEVFALPSNIDNPVALGSNELIRDGAQVALSSADVLHSIGFGLTKEKQELTQDENGVNLSPECLWVMKLLRSEAVHIDAILANPILNISQWRMVLLDLELKGLIKQVPGQYYVKV